VPGIYDQLLKKIKKKKKPFLLDWLSLLAISMFMLYTILLYMWGAGSGR